MIDIADLRQPDQTRNLGVVPLLLSLGLIGVITRLHTYALID